MNPKARQAKSKARLARFESLSHEDEAAAAAARASLESIFIPPGRPLGTVVVEAKVSLAPIVAGASSLEKRKILSFLSFRWELSSIFH